MTSVSTIDLRDGRLIGYAQRGAGDGFPILHFHGLPSCRLELDAIDPRRLQHSGLRLICPDRPGVGHSTRAPGLKVLDWPRDVCELADALGLEQFAVSGYSAGGPYALACARTLPQRVLGVAVLAGLAPPDVPGGHRLLSRTDRLTFSLARYATPIATALWLHARRQARRRPKRFIGSLAADFPALPDRAALGGEIGLLVREVFLETCRPGVRGVIDDYRALGDGWGFAPEEVEVPVRWVHGELDRTIPLEHGRWTADRLPEAELEVLAGEGHLLPSQRFVDVWCQLKEASRAYV